MPAYSGDSRASEGKGRRFYAEGREKRWESRDWFCRTCSTSESGIKIPTGWYRLERKNDENNVPQPWLRLGIYCSLRCIAHMMPRLLGIEERADAGDFTPVETNQLNPQRWDRRAG